MREPSVGIFPRYMLTTVSGKNVKNKNKINLGPAVLTSHILQEKGADSDICRKIKQEFIKINIWMCANFLYEMVSTLTQNNKVK